ncbi:MAG: aminopeptidase P N-terminal domain-containing protein [Pseudomonadota bacterium]
MQTEFSTRQKKLLQTLDNDSIAIIPAGQKLLRNGDSHYPFRQDSNFYYLTGFPEADSLAVFVPNHDEGEYILFCQEKNPSKEIWDGKIIGVEAACEIYGADKAYAYSSLETKLPQLMQNRKKLYYDFSIHLNFDKRILAWLENLRTLVRRGISPPNEIVSLRQILHEWRLYKSAGEQQRMQEAADISAQAHINAMQICKPGMYEYQLEAELIRTFLNHGAMSPAYPPIVGSGKNACILHYISNQAELHDGDCVLIDSGAEKNFYGADLTRSFPVNGKFSTEQKAIYEIVLTAQKAAIAKAHHQTNWSEMQNAIIPIITQGLIDLGLIKMSLADAIAQKAYFDFYMHGNGHWLGLDTHDAGEYKIDGQWRNLANDMVLTVEPGIYISPSNEKVAPRWRGIGIRIEDDIVIRDKNPIILTKDAPKEIDEIEAIMAG